MKLAYLPVNAAWVFVFGSDVRFLSIVTLEGFPRFFTRRSEAVEAARFRGLKVDRNNNVST